MDSGPSGGGGGGGKIRTKRYHLSGATSKPYPRNKQGLINKVKESVKSIVPTWLQRYFRQNEEAPSNEQRSQEENVNYYPAFEDDIADNNLEIDGRITPEPTRIISEEPSTSRSELNFTDCLTRPSLHRSHLNCNILDSPPPFCQPSTSSAFPISNSGLSLGKEIKDSTSQHDDDNISTTSGFSSRASDKDVAVSKNASVPPLWSLEAERPVSLSQHTTTSSKKPSFNLSAFGALSPSLGNASILKTTQLGNSPFYPGKTTYGGAAAAARQSKARITPYQTPIRRQMKAKQVNAQSYGVTSSTARRILQSLEKMSSPLADAKRIPSVSSPLSSPIERNLSNITDLHSPRKAGSSSPPVQKLVTPKAASVSMSRSQYFKPSLTSAIEPSRIRKRIEINNKEVKEKNLAVEQQMKPSESSNKKLTFSTTSSNGLPPTAVGGSSGGKMKRERGIHYVSKSAQEEEEQEMPVLPEISLPISTSSLPNFSFAPLTSTTVSSSPVTAAQSVANKVKPASNSSNPVFTFSSPIVKSTEAEVLPPVSSISGFKFSAPVAKSSETSGSKDTPVLPLDNAAINSISNKKENEYDGPFKPSKILKEGSVLDILKSPGFASPATCSSAATPPVATSTAVYTRPAISSFSGTSSGFADCSKQVSTYWQCETCLVQNNLADNKCIACQTAKVPASDGTKQTGTLTQSNAIKLVVSSTGTQGFGDKFKPASGTWDCDTCLVRNKPEATKCVACETPKPGTGVKPTLVFPVVTENAATVSSSSSCTDVTVNVGFGDKFKKPKGAWECSVCLVTNKAEDNKCVACQSAKPGGSVPMMSSSASSSPALTGGFLNLDQFKKPEGSWDCEICLVQNKADANKCVACENAKPGSKPEPEGFTTAASSSASSAPTFKFGIQSSSSPSESHQGLGSAGKSFKFGEQAGFKFGIGSESGSTANSMAGGFKFTVSEGSKGGSFLSEPKSEDSVKDGKTSSFNFGLSSGASSMSTFQFGVANLGQQEKKEELNKPSVGSFSFGTNSIATPENKTGISNFKFGNVEEKEAVVTPFSFKKAEVKKDENPSAKSGFTFGNVESKTAPQLVLGRTDEKKESVASYPLVYGEKTESEESKAQPVFSFGKTEQTKDDSTVKSAFSFGLAKPAEKETEQNKAAFSFGVSASAADPGTAKSAFSFLSSTSSNAVVPSVSAGGSSNNPFSSTTSAANPPPVAPTFLFGQANNTVSSSPFGNSSESKVPQSFGFSQESKPPTTTSSTNADFPFLFCPVTTTPSTANTGFSFTAAAATATPTASSTGSSSSFVFGSGSSAPTAGPAFGASQTPSFGQSQGTNQPSAPTFGSLSSSLFSASSQPGPPAFGSVASSAQPAVFGQQAPQQPGFGSSAAPSSGSAFQFGSSTTNFNFTGNTPGVFTFGANPTSQPPGSSGFSFTQPSAFNPGNNGRNIFSASGSSVSTRKIKTAVRRRK